MGKSSGSAPDPAETAAAQGLANKEAVLESAKVNQIQEYTPYGSSIYTGGIGEPDRTRTTSLAPQYQSIQDSLSSLANQLLGGYGYQPFNLSPAGQNLPYDPQYGGNQLLNRALSQEFGYGGDFGSGGFGDYREQQSPETQTQIEQFIGGFNPLTYSGFQQQGGYSPNYGAMPTSGSSPITLDPSLYSTENVRPEYDPRFGNNQLLNRALSDQFGFAGTFGEGGFNDFRQGQSPDVQGQISQFISGFDPQSYRVPQQNINVGSPLSSLSILRQGVGSLPGLQQFTPPSRDDFSQERGRVEESLYNRATGRLDPMFAERERDLTTGLTNRGIPIGSEAYNEEMGRFGRERNDAYQNALAQAITGGGAEQSRLFGMDLAGQAQGFGQSLGTRNALFGELMSRTGAEQGAQSQLYGQALGLGGEGRSESALNLARQAQLFGQGAQQFGQDQTSRNQLLNEMLLQRTQPINELAALLQGSPAAGMPSFGSQAQYQVPSADVTSPIYANYNAQNQTNNALLGGLFGLGGAAIGAWPF